MDLRHLDTEPSADERDAIDRLLGPDPRETSVPLLEARRRRRLLLPALHALQDRVGRVTEGGLGYACRRLHVAPARDRDAHRDEQIAAPHRDERQHEARQKSTVAMVFGW